MATTPLPLRSSSFTTPQNVPDRVLSPSRQQQSEARRQARREQLRDFYGLRSPGGTGATTPPQSATGSVIPQSPSTPLPGVAQTLFQSAGGRPTPGGLAAPDVGNADFVAGRHATRAKSPRLGPSGRPEGLDISSSAFVPSEYYEDLISKASLSDLLKTTGTLAGDVGRLHSSRHTLVYNHHHQLFSAGESIALLNTHTPQLLDKVTALQEKYSDISQLADSVTIPSVQEGLDDEDREIVNARKVAQQGLERIRLMLMAGEEMDPVRAAWSKFEKPLRPFATDAQVAKVLEEGRELAGSDEEDVGADRTTQGS